MQTNRCLLIHAVSIHDEVLYEMLDSLIISRVAGNDIVSPYVVMNIEEPRITKVLHAEVEILLLLFFLIWIVSQDPLCYRSLFDPIIN